MSKLSEFAAIAQPVERILGKDEVASSNLASSSKNKVVPSGTALFFAATPDLKTINATPRWGVAATSANTGGFFYFCLRQKCKQIC